jgi:protease II
MADKDIKGTVELYVSSEAGGDIKKLSGTLVAGGDVVDFRISPDAKFVAYVADQDTNQVFELYVSETDKLIDDAEVKVSVTMAGFGVEDNFQWADDSSRIAYLADQDEINVIELYTSTAIGSDNDQASGDLVLGGSVAEFKWDPDSEGLGYIADQDTFGVDELYISSPSGTKNAKVSGELVAGGSVSRFEWVP